MNIQAVGIIRSRGQLTIPDKIRKSHSWTSPNSVVTIISDKSDEIVIKPHQTKVDWDKIWAGIRKARAIKGKGRGSLSKFIAKDRYRH